MSAHPVPSRRVLRRTARAWLLLSKGTNWRRDQGRPCCSRDHASSWPSQPRFTMSNSPAPRAKSKIHDISPRSPRVFRVCFQRSAAFASSMAIFVATMRTNESSGDHPCSKLRETNSLAAALARPNFASTHTRPVWVGWDATWSPLVSAGLEPKQ